MRHLTEDTWFIPEKHKGHQIYSVDEILYENFKKVVGSLSIEILIEKSIAGKGDDHALCYIIISFH